MSTRIPPGYRPIPSLPPYAVSQAGEVIRVNKTVGRRATPPSHPMTAFVLLEVAGKQRRVVICDLVQAAWGEA